MRNSLFILAAIFSIGITKTAFAKTATVKPSPKTVGELIDKIKKTVKSRHFRWDLSLFEEGGLKVGGYTVNNFPLVYYTCGDKNADNKSLILSAVHGDEVAPVYFGFRIVEWLKARPEICKNKYIVVAPMVNPDGFFRYRRGTRTNYHKVDLNRNFDTPDWEEYALKLWKTKGREQRRYYPGDKPASEPETIFQKWLIDEFTPRKIMTVHAPLNILDYDGPKTEEFKIFSDAYVNSCEALKKAVRAATPDLKFFAYGIFPGSLGNYAGKQRGIPTFTVEFPTINPALAPAYFGDLESGTRLFVNYELDENPTKISAAEKKRDPAN